MTRRIFAAFASAMLISTPVISQTPDGNLQEMLEAARKLEYPEWSDNRAWLLEKLETIRSPVAVVFGYADNGAACSQIAAVLTASGVAGGFECSPIY
jgi:hypothetical protein